MLPSNIAEGTKWQAFGRHNLQLHFHVSNVLSYSTVIEFNWHLFPINNALVQIMTWHRTDDKSSSEPMFGLVYWSLCASLGLNKSICVAQQFINNQQSLQARHVIHMCWNTPLNSLTLGAVVVNLKAWPSYTDYSMPNKSTLVQAIAITMTS